MFRLELPLCTLNPIFPDRIEQIYGFHWSKINPAVHIPCVHMPMPCHACVPFSYFRYGVHQPWKLFLALLSHMLTPIISPILTKTIQTITNSTPPPQLSCYR